MVKRQALCNLVLAVAVLGPLAGCSSPSSEEEHNGSQYAELEGWEWPLTVEWVSFRCPGAGQLVIVADGEEYAGNGLAKSAGYTDIDPIWRDDPDVEGLKVPIGDLIEWGNEECGYPT